MCRELVRAGTPGGRRNGNAASPGWRDIPQLSGADFSVWNFRAVSEFIAYGYGGCRFWLASHPKLFFFHGHVVVQHYPSAPSGLYFCGLASAVSGSYRMVGVRLLEVSFDF